jgi:glycosyltransferase involved in cell wall biosynthesis
VPKISVILPVYNGEAWLGPCIRSALDQTLGDFELLVGDDSSTDRSRGIIASFNSDSRLRFFQSDRNVGLFGNLNQLLAKAQAPIVRFLCQDDLMEAHCLADEVEYFDNHPDVVMCICSVHLIDCQNRVVGEYGAGPNIFTPGQCLQLLLYYGCIAGNLSTVSVRRSAIEQVEGFDESFRMAGDYEMWVRICQLGNVADRHEKLVKLREHPGRLSHATGGGVVFVAENRRIRAKILNMLPGRIRRRAVRYIYLRQNVLEAHHFIRRLMAGSFDECATLIRIMGFRDLAAGLIIWLLTVNNRLYQPRPFFE